MTANRKDFRRLLLSCPIDRAALVFDVLEPARPLLIGRFYVSSRTRRSMQGFHAEPGWNLPLEPAAGSVGWWTASSSARSCISGSGGPRPVPRLTVSAGSGGRHHSPFSRIHGSASKISPSVDLLTVAEKNDGQTVTLAAFELRTPRLVAPTSQILWAVHLGRTDLEPRSSPEVAISEKPRSQGRPDWSGQQGCAKA
jgi:hypothetical protein